VAASKDSNWPGEIVEVPAMGPDPHAEDPQRTKRIDKSELEEVLKRTKSGFRRAVREGDPENEDEPDADAPPVDPAQPEAAAPLEAPHLSAVPAPVISLKPDSAPLPEPPSTHIVSEAPPAMVRMAPTASRWVLGLVVAALTFAALAVGYALGHAR
jgi:hypothetical protein